MAVEQIGTSLTVSIPSGLKISGYVVEDVTQERVKESEYFTDEDGEVITILTSGKGIKYNYTIATKDSSNVSAIVSADTISINSVPHYIEPGASVKYAKNKEVAVVSFVAFKPDNLSIS